MRLQTATGRCYLVNSFEVHLDGCYIWLIALSQTKRERRRKGAPELPAPGLRGLTHSEQYRPGSQLSEGFETGGEVSRRSGS
jgi:hypothetical protein